MDSTVLSGVAAILWPIIAAAVIFSFRNNVKALLVSAQTRKFTIKVGEQQLTVEEANDQQTQLVADLRNRLLVVESAVSKFHPAETLERSAAIPSIQSTTPSVLWVDDNPRHNATLSQQLEGLGVNIVIALSTSDAMSKFNSKKFDRIISDMGRTEEDGVYRETAGLDLTRAVRKIDQNVPIVIYSSLRAVQRYRDEALAAGANEITASATLLIKSLHLSIHS